VRRIGPEARVDGSWQRVVRLDAQQKCPHVDEVLASREHDKRSLELALVEQNVVPHRETRRRLVVHHRRFKHLEGRERGVRDVAKACAAADELVLRQPVHRGRRAASS